jgi:hypothetical protein
LRALIAEYVAIMPTRVVQRDDAIPAALHLSVFRRTTAFAASLVLLIVMAFSTRCCWRGAAISSAW